MKICIIGAGPCGLISAKHTIDNGYECQLFEQTDKVGGTWNYTDCTDEDEHGEPVHTAMYQSLRTNLPKEIMEYEGFPYPTDLKESFITREHVLTYFQRFADHFMLHRYIQFLKRVINVRPIPNNRWRVTIRDVLKKSEETREFDAVMVCNGHYNSPYYPPIPGRQLFHGNQMHSFSYRKPEPFKDQTVLVIGASFSGKDIAKQIGTLGNNKVFLSHRNPTSLNVKQSNIIEKPEVIKIEEDQVEFKDGSKSQVDTIIYATGYSYSFPFLSAECKINVNDNWVQYLYKHVVNVEYPTMYFIGLLFAVVTIPLFDNQVKFCLSLLRKHAALPEKNEMMKEILQRRQDLETKGIPQKHYHKLQDSEKEAYFADIATAGKIKAMPTVIMKIYRHAAANRESNPLPKYRIIDDENFELI